VKTFTFHNVLIAVEAETAEEAYKKLTTVLDPKNGVIGEYETDTYSDDDFGDQHSTTELMSK
jgi:hypothetical protein